MTTVDKTLNQAQKEAVSTLEGPLLIVAGAGAGKTKTLIERMAALIAKGVPAGEILAITFTNKAAREMRERVGPFLSRALPRSHIPFGFDDLPFIGTFHALGAFIIRENTDRLGLPRHFSVHDRDDSKKAVREAMEISGISHKEYEPGRVLSYISRSKGDGITPDEARHRARSDFHSIAARVYGEYERLLERDRALDFDDLLVKAELLLKKFPDVLERYQERWKYIHIDEYQDTNEVQYSIARLLAQKYGNICVVGDADQNIYSWRGASLKNILSFEKDYPDAKVIVLEENYRSTQKILDAANSVISKNALRKDKNLYTKNAEGENLSLFSAFDEATEALFVAEKVRELIRQGVPAKEIAVLFRANFQSRIIEETFLRLGIPYEITGTRFFERKEVKDAVSFLRLALNPESGADIARAVNAIPRGLGKVSLLHILSGHIDKLSPKARASYGELRSAISKISSAAAQNHVAETVRISLKESGILEHYEKQARMGDGDAEERLENLTELVSVASRYDASGEEGLALFLADAALESGEDTNTEEGKGVKIMTVHSAKGLEFDVVFLVGLEEGLFPHSKMYEDNLTEEEREEERRLMYVAITRARKKLFLTFAQTRLVYGSREINIPSSFIDDIPAHHVDVEESEYGGRRGLLTSIDF